jgi:predicted nucleotidyltransferase
MKIQGHEILFKTLVGSHSYGTNIEGSDHDYKGVFIQDPKDKYLNGYKDELEVHKDEKYFEIEKFLIACSTGNPTQLELLYAPKECIEYISPLFKKEVMSIRDLFLTKTLRHSFASYATEQIRKAKGLDKKMNWEGKRITRRTVEDMCTIYPLNENKSIFQHYLKSLKEMIKGDVEMFQSSAMPLAYFLEKNKMSAKHCGLVKIDHFRDCYLLFNDPKDLKYRGITSGTNANDISLSVVSKDARPDGILFFHKDAYSIHCKEWNEYEKWLEERNTQRYVDIEGHNQKIDGKNILHCVRLIETAMEIPLLKTINVKRENKDFLIEIRKGKHDLQKLLDKCEISLKELNDAFIKSDLPDRFENKELITNLINSIREDYFNNYVRQTSWLWRMTAKW